MAAGITGTLGYFADCFFNKPGGKVLAKKAV
jgi:hypothetical protein